MTQVLFFHRIGGEPVVEAYLLARHLGYAQQHLLRKQLLTDWRDHFQEGEDFVSVHDVAELRRYEGALGEAPVSSARGRIFLTRRGVGKVLERTTKDTTELVRELGRLEGSAGAVESEGKPRVRTGLRVPESQPSSRSEDQPSSRSEDQPPSRSEDQPPSEDLWPQARTDLPKRARRPRARTGLERHPELAGPLEAPQIGTLEIRRFEHGVLENLLERLRDVGREPGPLQELALLSAETALGRPLTEVRESLRVERTQGGIKNLIAGLAGPGSRAFPLEPRYSLTEIGRRAGGYSSVAAGRAADVVAQRLGYTHQQIREMPLPFNELERRVDAHGREYIRVRFNSAFANEVAAELQASSAFKVSEKAELEDDFGSSDRSLPKLTRGPFEDP